LPARRATKLRPLVFCRKQGAKHDRYFCLLWWTAALKSARDRSLSGAWD
jgi:hypothetical protein